MNSAPRYLIVAPAWVGDMVMSQVLYARLRDAGAARIEVVAPPATAPLLARMHQVDHTHVLHAAHGQLAVVERWRLGRRLRSRFDVAVVLPGSWKSALVPAVARVPRRRGWLGEQRRGLLNEVQPLQPERFPRMVDRFAALADANFAPPGEIVAPHLQVDSGRRAALLTALQLDPGSPAVALCPGAEFGAAKRWPAEHFAQLARQLLQAGFQVWIVGGRGDLAVAGAIAAQAPGAYNLAGRTQLIDAVDLLSAVQAVVTNDSGLMHVAAAVDVPVVAVYGSTSPAFTPPLSVRARIVRQQLDCQPCFARTCPLGHLRCLREITPARVRAELGPLLEAA